MLILLMMFTFSFWTKITFLRKYGPKNQNCLFEMKLEIWHLDYLPVVNCWGEWKVKSHFPRSFTTDFTLQDLHFIRVWPKKRIYANFVNPLLLSDVPWNKTPENNSNRLNSMVMFTFCVLDWKYTLWVNLVQKINFFCLR